MAYVQKIKIRSIIESLRQEYPGAECALEFHDPFQLLVSVVLSAQTTDKSVNQITPVLFARFPDATAMAEAESLEVEDILRRIGMYRTKAKNIIELSKILARQYGGQVPDQYEALLSLPGVGRKTANVVLAVGFGVPRIAVDTHVFRLSNRIGLTAESDVTKTEEGLMSCIPIADWIMMHHSLILHGRSICTARKPKCSDCVLLPWCKRNGLEPMETKNTKTKTIKIEDLVLGSGTAKICFPLVAATEAALRKEAGDAKAAAADLVEWRADKYLTDDPSELLRVLTGLRQDMGKTPLLFTYRSKREGGDGSLPEENYRELLLSVIRSKLADLIDIEYSCGDGTIQTLLNESKSNGVVTVLSSHRLNDTPSQKDMEEVFEKMIVLGADLPKLAVMAVEDNDVLRLLGATDRISKKHGMPPLIAISMGDKGRLSRIAGSQFGSCVTFAAGNEPSAPGQIRIGPLQEALRILSL
jgi:endonuclease-3